MPTYLPIAAYMERESFDPETGDPGILRDEWRVRDVADFAPGALVAAWGPDWRRYKPFASHVLEHRYVRRGVEEPWKPAQSANSEEQALQHIDDKAVALDPYLKELQQLRMLTQEKERKVEEEKRRREIEAYERRYHRGRSAEAFKKLLASKDAAWAERWNVWIAAHQSDAARAAAERDPEFMRLHHAAFDAETVPAKRKAIKEFLAYVEGRREFGRFGGLDGLELEDEMSESRTCVRTADGKIACGERIGASARGVMFHGTLVPLPQYARSLLSAWHRGQASAAYSVASRGKGEPETIFRAALELRDDAKAHPSRSKERRELDEMSTYLEALAAQAGYVGAD